MKRKVMATDEEKRLRETKQSLVTLQCGGPLSFDEYSLDLIETAAQLRRGVARVLQRGLNQWDDAQLRAVLGSTPFASDDDLVVTQDVFRRIVSAASGGYLSEGDAVQLYRRANIMLQNLEEARMRKIRKFRMLTRTKSGLSRMNSSNGMSTPQTSQVSQWAVLTAMLSKMLMVAHLARTLSTGENLMAKSPQFMLQGPAATSSPIRKGVDRSLTVSAEAGAGRKRIGVKNNGGHTINAINDNLSTSSSLASTTSGMLQ